MKKTIARLALGAACLLIAGCGGGGGGDGSTSQDNAQPKPADYPVLDGAEATTYAKDPEFRAIDLFAHEEKALRQNLGLPSLCAGISNPDCASASTYALQNIHHAHTATLADGTKLRGKGTLIAVMDNGFLRGHQEFAGKTIHSFAGEVRAFAVKDHGTAVAGIAAGNADGKGTMGVAPEADLHLTSWHFANKSGSFLSHVAAGTDDAASHGAVVQNNSWGLATETPADEELAAFRASSANSYADYLAGGRSSLKKDWQRLFDAYDRFQKTGVIVFANSNDENLGAAGDGRADASSLAALPLFVPELAEAWLVVGNALFTVDESDGSILDADLISAPCGSAAAFCLTSDGSVYAPTAESKTSYDLATGVSFAAPQVSGQIALLAQAFPNLSPAEWTVRLLASARTDWEGFQRTISGTRIFGSGVSHPYSRLYGHGVPDMKAALSPIGGLSIASGANVFSGRRTSLEGGVNTAGPVIGNALAKAMAERRIMLVDALGTDFYLPGRALGAGGSPSSSPADPGRFARNVEEISESFSFAEIPSRSRPALESAAMPKLFFSQAHGDLGGENAFFRLLPLADGGFLQMAGQMTQADDAASSAFSLSRLMGNERFATEVTLSFSHSQNRFFGHAARGPFVPSSDTGTVATGFSIGTALSPGWSVGAYAEFGSGFVGNDPDALVNYGAFAYASGGLSARRHGVLNGGDTLDLYAGIRPTAVAGEADLRLPVGRDADGTIHYERIAVDLAEADLPLRIGFVYRNRFESGFDMAFGLNTDFVASGDPDPVLSVSLGLKKSF